MQDVTAAIAENGDGVLIARRADGRHAGWWEFPGGKVELGESPEECLQRELHEEFGADATIGRYVTESVFDYGSGQIRLIAYEVVFHGELCPVDHDKIAWVPVGELLEYQLLPADIPIAERLQTYLSG